MTTSKPYSIYIHKNKVNNKMYIGMTNRKLETRFGKEGKNYKNSIRFYNAIQKYGWENFEHILLLSGLSRQQAEEKEKEIIAKYNTTNNEFGYNISKGGTGGNNKKTLKIKKYDLEGNYICLYNSAAEAARDIGGNRACITHCCKAEKSKHKYKNFMWCYENENICLPYKNSATKAISQYDLNGNFIRGFDSVTEAAKEVKGDASAISRCASHKQKYAYNYLWEWGV